MKGQKDLIRHIENIRRRRIQLENVKIKDLFTTGTKPLESDFTQTWPTSFRQMVSNKVSKCFIYNKGAKLKLAGLIF